MNLVSVIVPYFKKKRYILETINSILNQTHKNLEIIVVYDDKNKSDIQYLNKIKKKDKRIKLVVNNETLGAGFARNKGIKLAKGDYIAFIDADDIWKKNKIDKQLNYMKLVNASISHTSYKIFRKKNQILKIRRAKNFFSLNDLLYSCDIGLSTVMVKKKILRNKCLFPSLKTKEDFVLWLSILQKNKKIYALDESLTLWRKLDNSLSSSVVQKLKDGFIVYNKFMKFNFIKSLFFLFFLSFNSLLK